MIHTAAGSLPAAFFTVRTAQLMMQIAREDPGRALVRYRIAKASILLRVSLEVRKELFDTHNVTQLSVAA